MKQKTLVIEELAYELQQFKDDRFKNLQFDAIENIANDVVTATIKKVMNAPRFSKDQTKNMHAVALLRIARDMRRSMYPRTNETESRKPLLYYGQAETVLPMLMPYIKKHGTVRVILLDPPHERSSAKSEVSI